MTLPNPRPSQSSELLSDQWLVTTGVVATGPMSFSRVRQDVSNGRLPADCLVRHESWRVWRRLDEIEGLSGPERRSTVERLSGICASAELRATDPSSELPPPLPGPPTIFDERPSRPPLSTIRPSAVDPVRVLSQAHDLEDALLLALSTSVTAANADAGLLHRSRRELGVMVTTFAHGETAEMLLGDRLANDDPSLLTAREGRTVLAEPQLGEVGRYIAGRLSRCLGAVHGIAMVPVVVFGQTYAMIELGRCDPPFRAREIARVEDVVEALTGRIVVTGWLS